MKAKRSTFGEVIYLLSTIISWTIFALLVICAILLVYYFVATKIYAKKGSGYEPRFSLYTIISPSMVPNIKVYDVVVDVKVNDPSDIKINDVITFNSDKPELHGGTITHRVISITKDENGNYLYQTKGDSNLVEDDGLVEYNKIVGKVAFKIPQLGRLQFFLASSFGWLTVILIPALFIIIKDILKLLKIIKDPNEESSKFLKLLNRPILGGHKPKLLKYTEAKVEDNIPINTSSTVENYSPFSVMDDDEEMDDLPSLK